jgi:hypothetical protein
MYRHADTEHRLFPREITGSTGTKKQEVKREKAVLRIRDVYPGSWIRIFFIPDPNFFHPGSEFFHPGSASKNLSILTQKIVVGHPDPDPDFLPIPDPGVKKAPDPQH